MNITCTLLMTCNGIMGWLSSLGFLQWMQLIGILASIVASFYVSYNQHLNIKWKRNQDKKNRNNETEPQQ